MNITIETYEKILSSVLEKARKQQIDRWLDYNDIKLEEVFEKVECVYIILSGLHSDAEALAYTIAERFEKVLKKRVFVCLSVGFVSRRI